MKICADDTIAAVSTPPGRSAVALIRISGKDALKTASRIFFPASGKKVTELKSHTIHYGEVRHKGRVIDEVMVSVMRSPSSYTGEDTVEITCHGGGCVTAGVLDAALSGGARPAGPGEFTMRAFLNGKMDLTQAEAVNHLINAKSEKARKCALDILKGELGKRIREAGKAVMDARVNVDARLEWGETEGVTTLSNRDISTIILRAAAILSEIINDSYDAEKLTEGYKAVICGMPNAGKSSLFNLLLNRERSIVDREAGTTRDTVDSGIIFEGVLVNLYDTAGVGLDNPSPVDVAAAAKTEEEMLTADLVIYVIDGNVGPLEHDRKFLDKADGRKVLTVLNKSDLSSARIYPEWLPPDRSVISCRDRNGIPELRKRIEEALSDGNKSGIMITARQRGLLKEASECLHRASNMVANGDDELASCDLADASQRIGEVEGREAREDILDRVFSGFCIGK